MTDRLDPPPVAAPGGPVGTWPWITGAPGPADAQPPEPPPDDGPKPPTRRARSATRLRRAAPFLLGIVATFIAIALYGALFPPKPPLTTADVTDTVNKVLASQTPPPATSELVFNAIRPSLVLIQVDLPVDAADPSPAPNGVGSGVIINDAGLVMTAYHVVSDAKTIHLTFADGSKSDAVISSSDPDTDIAVLQPAQPPSGLQPATLGNPGAMQVGSEAYIVGNPFGLYDSMSAGVVSGLDRSFKDPRSDRVFKGLIQVDAAVNPGNSGGPLLDRGGNVVGIVTALINPTKEDVFIGIGLAVPIDVAGGAAGAPQY